MNRARRSLSVSPKTMKRSHCTTIRLRINTDRAPRLCIFSISMAHAARKKLCALCLESPLCSFFKNEIKDAIFRKFFLCAAPRRDRRLYLGRGTWADDKDAAIFTIIRCYSDGENYANVGSRGENSQTGSLIGNSWFTGCHRTAENLNCLRYLNLHFSIITFVCALPLDGAATSFRAHIAFSSRLRASPEHIRVRVTMCCQASDEIRALNVIRRVLKSSRTHITWALSSRSYSNRGQSTGRVTYVDGLGPYVIAVASRSPTSIS